MIIQMGGHAVKLIFRKRLFVETVLILCIIVSVSQNGATMNDPHPSRYHQQRQLELESVS